MHRRERLKPPTPFYPPDEWSLIENGFQPAFIAQMESVMALGNGFLGRFALEFLSEDQPIRRKTRRG